MRLSPIYGSPHAPFRLKAEATLQRYSTLNTPRIVNQCPGNEQTNGYSPRSAGASNAITADSRALSRGEATSTFGESGTKPRSCALGSFIDPNSSFSYAAMLPR